jgi:hypothetical protein
MTWTSVGVVVTRESSWLTIVAKRFATAVDMIATW